MMTFNEFCQIMDKTTNGFECLCLWNRSRSNDLDTMLYWYVANYATAESCRTCNDNGFVIRDKTLTTRDGVGEGERRITYDENRSMFEYYEDNVLKAEHIYNKADSSQGSSDVSGGCVQSPVTITVSSEYFSPGYSEYYYTTSDSNGNGGLFGCINAIRGTNKFTYGN